MIGVIVLSGPFSGMHGLDTDRSPSLLPLGDRSALQHIVESLVTQGIVRIEIVAGHGPEQAEHLLGNGDRWGCSFRYHLSAQRDCPYRSLKVIAGLATEPWVLIHAERYPCVDFARRNSDEPTLYYGKFPSDPDDTSASSIWGGTVVMPPTEITDEIANFSTQELRAYFDACLKSGAAEVIETDGWIDVSSPARMLESQARLLDKNLRGLLISGAERQPGIWVARNATIHPSVRLTSPLYVGTNTRLGKGVSLGPYAVIGPDCIVDSNTVIDNALVFQGSYIGEGLEVHQAIVAHNLLVNVRLDASIDIAENFLLGRIDSSHPRGAAARILQPVLALLLAIVFLPITILAWLYYGLIRGFSFTSIQAVCLPGDEKQAPVETFALPCLGADAWDAPRPASWETFCRQFLPGLFAVIRGQISLVGLPPRTIQQVQSLDEDWRVLYLEGRAGLITEAATVATDNPDPMQLYLADAYYSVQHGFQHKFGLMFKYFTHLIVPAHKQR